MPFYAPRFQVSQVAGYAKILEVYPAAELRDVRYRVHIACCDTIQIKSHRSLLMAMEREWCPVCQRDHPRPITAPSTPKPIVVKAPPEPIYPVLLPEWLHLAFHAWPKPASITPKVWGAQ